MPAVMRVCLRPEPDGCWIATIERNYREVARATQTTQRGAFAKARRIYARRRAIMRRGPGIPRGQLAAPKGQEPGGQ